MSISLFGTSKYSYMISTYIIAISIKLPNLFIRNIENVHVFLYEIRTDKFAHEYKIFEYLGITGGRAYATY